MAKQSQGVIAYWSTTTSVATAAGNVIGEVIGWNGPNQNANIIDVTHLLSTAKEKMVGLYDGGNITLNLNCVVTNDAQTKLRESLVARTKGNLMLQLSTVATSQKITQKGYVSNLSIIGAVDNVLRSDVTIEITGGVAITT